MHIKLIVFAMDGVICHLEHYHYLAWKSITDELGISFSEAQGKELVGLSRKDSLNYILQNYPATLSAAEKEVLAEQKNQEFRRIVEGLSHDDADPEVEAVLKDLKKRGYLLAITSPSKNVVSILNKLELEKYFDYISDGNINRKSKIKPDRYLTLCDYVHVRPEECALVEATERGRLAGKRAGMQVYGDIPSMLAALD